MTQIKSNPRFLLLGVLGLSALAFGAVGLLPERANAQSAGEGPEISQDGAEADQPIFIMPRSGPFSPQTIAVPNARVIAAWARAGHSDATSESFTHWDEEGEIPAVCSVCHSGAGFRSYHGLDGSEPGLPDAPIPAGGVVDCDTCHSPGISTIREVKFPSGVLHPVSGADVACSTCHQGRSAGTTVETAITDKPLDSTDPDLRFINPHYALAAATNLGAYGGVGYHYDEKEYSRRFNHAKPVETCVSCHDPHSLEVAEATCLTCHDSGDPDKIRIQRVSFDGSGQTSKGIRDDIDANAALLLGLIGDYAREVAGTGIIYDEARYPYFYVDANGDGLADQDGEQAIAYDAWTPRLVRSVYNWKVVTSDAGVHVHNPPYALELLYDSIEDMTAALERDMDELGLLR